jgi:HEPN domain-containing protein
MKRLTAEWVRKAEADYLAAKTLAGNRLPPHDAVCFHCQQSAKKYLKALLKEASVRVPRTHDLVAIVSLLPQEFPWRGFKRGLEFLTRFAVETRYPGESASKRQAASSLRWAGKVRDACRTLLDAKGRTA